MELKKSNYEIEIKKGAMKLFEEKVLFSGMCDFVIPMRFTDAGESRKITYDCSGCVALRDMYPLSTGEIFEILEKTLLTLNRSVEFFIPHEKVKIDKDTVCNRKNKDTIEYFLEDIESKRNFACIDCNGSILTKIYSDKILSIDNVHKNNSVRLNFLDEGIDDINKIVKYIIDNKFYYGDLYLNEISVK